MSDSKWFHVGASVRGTSHEAQGTPCQDYLRVETLEPDGEILIVAISDGAGSASHAEEGSKIVVEEWIDYFRKLLEDNPKPETIINEIDEKDIANLIQSITARVAKASTLYNVNPSEFSATMLGAVIHENGGFVAQVGDGCWVLRCNSILACVTWPVCGEFVGQTVFVTSETATEYIQVGKLPLGFDALLGFTDGIERIAIDLTAMLPSPAFFLPLERGLREMGDDSERLLREFLGSDRVCSATDDDKSLVVILKTDASI